MNCSMMYKKILFCIAGFLIISFASMRKSMSSFAEEAPKGDILIIYQDNAADNTKAAVEDLVKLLTFKALRSAMARLPGGWSI